MAVRTLPLVVSLDTVLASYANTLLVPEGTKLIDRATFVDTAQGSAVFLLTVDDVATEPVAPPTMTLHQLDLSTRTANTLRAIGGIWTVADLVEKTANELRALQGFGAVAMIEVTAALAKRGLKLKGQA